MAIMDFKKIIETVEASETFADWKKEHSKAHLCHAFIMTDNKGNGEWQIGYYIPDKDRISTAIIDNVAVSIKESDEVFKKPDDKVGEVELSKVKLGYDGALKKATELREKDYKQEIVMKTIAVLQNLKDFGLVWNITFITMQFNTLNFKIAADSGEIKHTEIKNIMKDMATFQKGERKH